MKRISNYICRNGSTHDGAGTSITNLWSVSPPELSFITNGFDNLAYLRSCYTNPAASPYTYTRRLQSSGAFTPNTSGNAIASLALRSAVHITEPKIRFVVIGLVSKKNNIT